MEAERERYREAEHWGCREGRRKSKGGCLALKSTREQSQVDEWRMLTHTPPPHVDWASRRPKAAQGGWMAQGKARSWGVK